MTAEQVAVWKSNKLARFRRKCPFKEWLRSEIRVNRKATKPLWATLRATCDTARLVALRPMARQALARGRRVRWRRLPGVL
jgi:hypothetical protein